jgi:hypothetical protein
MYDFFFGSSQDIENDPQTWLLSIKRMLPRWPNGIPDSEFLALFHLLNQYDYESTCTPNKRPVLIETGSGASTIVLLYFACKWNTCLYTWDIASTKLAFLRGVLNDTLFRQFRDLNMFNYWKYIAYDSTNQYAGIPILKETNDTVCAAFYDSEHTWQVLGSEIAATMPFLCNGSILAIDDANYAYKQSNTAYINMLRTKLDLPAVTVSNNECRPFWEEVESLLSQKFPRVKNLGGGTYRQNYKDDIFWSYYSSDRNNMNKLGMEKLENLAYRFEAWKVFLN